MKNGQDKGTDLVAVNADFGEIMVRRTETGQILRPVKAKMRLTKAAGHIYTAAGKSRITASGYYHLNKVASINLITPKDVVVDGHRWPNPYVERNSGTKAIETVNIRKIGIGFSPAGNITVFDVTLFYNLHTYLIQSFQAKMDADEWKKDKETGRNKKTGAKKFPDCARYGTRDDRPETKEGASWAWYSIADPIGIWVNYATDPIKDCLSEHIQRQRFGDRIAQTIVNRNILKNHPAIAISDVSGESAEVSIYGYKHDFGTDEIRSIEAQVEKGSEDLDVKKEEITPDLSEEKEAISEVVEGETENGSPDPDRDQRSLPGVKDD